MYSRVLILLVTLLIPVISFGSAVKDAKFKQISLRQGLSNASVTGIVKDNLGYMWIGTRDGLNRYDGVSIQVFKPGFPNSTGVTDNWIQAIEIDSDGIIWIGTYNGGVFYFDPLRLNFQTITTENSELIANRIFDLFVDKDDTIWIATSIGLQHYNPRTKIFETFTHNPEDSNSLSQDYVSTIAQAEDGTMWFGYWGTGISKFNVSNRQFAHFNSESHGLSSDLVRAIIEDENGQIWIGTAMGLNRFSVENEAMVSFLPDEETTETIPHNSIRDFIVDGNYLWIATDGGLSRKSINSGEFINFIHNPRDNFSIASPVIFSLYSDGYVLWAGTFTAGLSILHPSRNKFSHIRYIPETDNSLNHHHISSFASVNDSEIMVASNGGINIWNRDNFQISSLIDERHADTFQGSLRMTAIGKRGNRFYVGSDSKGLISFIYENGRVSQITEEHPDASSTRRILTDSNGSVWVATHLTGLFLKKRGESRFQQVSVPTGLDDLHENRIQNLFMDKDGNVWVLGYSNLVKFENYQPSLLITKESSVDGSFPAYPLRDATIDVLNNIWVATGGGGLCKITSLEESRFRCLIENDGLPSNEINSVLTGDDGRLWIGTGNGLASVHPISGSVTIFNESDGLQDIQFHAGATYQMEDGMMLFGGQNGFNAFYPQQLVLQTPPPPVHIQDMRIINRADSSAFTMAQHDYISVSHLENFFTFEFRVLDFAEPSRNLFSYKMEGLDDDWSTPSNRSFATYTNVPPGEYTFRVRGANADNIWNKEGALLTLKVVPPFWMNRSFIAFSVFLLLAMAAFLVTMRERRMKKRNENLTLVVAERTESLREQANDLIKARTEAEKANMAKSEFLAGISHELRTPLNAIIGFSEILRRDKALSDSQKHHVEVMNKSGKHLLSMINDVLDISKIESGHLDISSENFLLKETLSNLEAMFLLQCQEKGLELYFDISGNIPNAIRADIGKIRQILINLVGNAIKFTDEGKVVVTVDTVESDEQNHDNVTLLFSVSDTGRGIPPTELDQIFEPFRRTGDQRSVGTGLGLAICKRLAEVLGGTIEVESTLGQGSEFTFTIPVELSKKGANQIINDVIPHLEIFPESTNFNILIVDDNEDNLELLKAILQPLGFRCFEARSGEEAIDSYKKYFPHLIFMDISMPGMGGVRATERINNLSDYAVPIVAVTAGVFSKQDKKTEKEFSGVIFKPFTMDNILHEVAKQLKLDLKESAKKISADIPDINALTDYVNNLKEPQKSKFIEAMELSDFSSMAQIIESLEESDWGTEVLKSCIERKDYSLLLALTEKFTED